MGKYLKCVKAVPTSDPYGLVYACQFTEAEWAFQPSFLPAGPGKIYLLRLKKIHVVFPDDWLIWHPVSISYEIMSDFAFREKYNLYDDLPPRIKTIADQFPSYGNWVEMCNKDSLKV